LEDIIYDAPFFDQRWALNNTDQFNGIPDADIDAVEAWLMTKGSSNIRIAVLDEGVTCNHPDLPNQYIILWFSAGKDSKYL